MNKRTINKLVDRYYELLKELTKTNEPNKVEKQLQDIENTIGKLDINDLVSVRDLCETFEPWAYGKLRQFNISSVYNDSNGVEIDLTVDEFTMMALWIGNATDLFEKLVKHKPYSIPFNEYKQETIKSVEKHFENQLQKMCSELKRDN
jgi:prophage maintenance system killer protein